MGEDEILELLAYLAPETLEGWLAAAVIICAVAAVAVPPPPEDAHPLWKIVHRIISIVGLGAGKMRAAGRIGKLGQLFRRKK